jgi:hypothetical protein
LKLTSTFEINGWGVAETCGVDELADVSRATIRKSFSARASVMDYC